MYKILFSDRLNLAVAIHFGSYVGAEAITAGKELLADARFTKTHNVLWDMRRVTSMTLYDTDRAFAHQAGKAVYEPLSDSRIVLLYDPDNPVNKIHKKNREWGKVIWDKPHSLSYDIAKIAGKGIIKENKSLFWLLTFGLGILGSLLYILPNLILLGPPGIKNNGIYFNSSTNRGFLGWFVFLFLVVLLFS